MDPFVSVYIDMAATVDDVRIAVSELPLPPDVDRAVVDCTAFTDTFGCRIAVDLIGSFDERTQGLAIARRYSQQLSAALKVPAYPLQDLLRRGYTAS